MWSISILPGGLWEVSPFQYTPSHPHLSNRWCWHVSADIYIYIIYRSRLSRCQCLAHLFCFGPPGFVPPFGRPPVALAGVSGTNSSMEMVVWPLFMAYGILFAVSSKRGIKEAQTERKQSVLVDVELWKKTKTRRSYKDVNLSICKHVSLWGLTHQTVVCSDILK